MKKIFFLICTAFIMQSCCYWGCPDDGVVSEFESGYDPIIETRDIFESSVTITSPQALVDTGKIYVIGDKLFVNEKHKGFHVFDNANPSSPQVIGFINAPGATDIAIKEQTLYINQAVDLIAVTVNSNLDELTVTKRIKNIFPVLLSPDGYYPYDLQVDSIVVGWKLKN